MTRPFDTWLLDRVQAENRQRQEDERLQTLQQVEGWLNTHGAQYSIEQAYLFGSLICPYGYRSQSDVDIAVEAMEPDAFFGVIAALSETIGRDVDLVELCKCPFADRIRQTGRLWTKSNLPC